MGTDWFRAGAIFKIVKNLYRIGAAALNTTRTAPLA